MYTGCNTPAFVNSEQGTRYATTELYDMIRYTSYIAHICIADNINGWNSCIPAHVTVNHYW